MALNAYARSAADALLRPVVSGLVRVGATADGLTLTGIAIVVAGSGLIATGELQIGAIVVACGAILDALDGGVARARGSQSRYGAFLDSVTDRVADMALFGAVAWLMREDPLLFAVTLVALGAAQVTSYMRAKAESLGWNATVGVIERAERVAILLIGVCFTVLLPAALWILAVGGLVTVAQRMRTVRRQAGVA